MRFGAEQVQEYGASVTADACGLGKTFQYLALILAAYRYWEQQGSKDLQPEKPTLVAVPGTLMERSVRYARNSVTRNGWKSGTTKAHIPAGSSRMSEMCTHCRTRTQLPVAQRTSFPSASMRSVARTLTRKIRMQPATSPSISSSINHMISAMFTPRSPTLLVVLERDSCTASLRLYASTFGRPRDSRGARKL